MAEGDRNVAVRRRAERLISDKWYYLRLVRSKVRNNIQEKPSARVQAIDNNVLVKVI